MEIAFCAGIIVITVCLTLMAEKVVLAFCDRFRTQLCKKKMSPAKTHHVNKDADEMDRAPAFALSSRGGLARRSDRDAEGQIEMLREQLRGFSQQCERHAEICPLAGVRVYMSDKGRCWHLNETCPQFKGKAKISAFRPCGTCCSCPPLGVKSDY